MCANIILTNDATVKLRKGLLTALILTLCNELPMCRRRRMVMAVCVSIVHCGPGLREPSYSSQDQDNTGEG